MTALATGIVASGALDRHRVVLALGWIAAAACLFGAALWLSAIPPSLSSDDALFLLRSLTRFSILDFSPQFPGYPGTVAMGRLALIFTRDPLAALALTSAAIALAIPPAAAWLTWRITAAPWASLAAFFITLVGPLMPDLAASLLSDGAGILFLLIFLALLPKDGEPVRLRLFLAGLALGWAAACRPSDAPLFAGAIVAVAFVRPRWAGLVALGVGAVLIPVATIVYALEGPLYFAEGIRFLSGHALIWGNTSLAPGAGQHESWQGTLAAVPFAVPMAVLVLAGIIAAVVLRGRSPALKALLAAFVAHAVFIVAFQNPDHLRHVAPLVVLGGVAFVSALAAPQFKRLRFVALAVLAATEVASLAATGAISAAARPSPLASAISWIAAHPPAALATNEGVFTLRAALPQSRVYDAHYAADAALGLASAAGPAYRLTGTPLAGTEPAAAFPARFPGERTLTLYAVRWTRIVTRRASADNGRTGGSR